VARADGGQRPLEPLCLAWDQPRQSQAVP
jgi:hypothetical protein